MTDSGHYDLSALANGKVSFCARSDPAERKAVRVRFPSNAQQRHELLNGLVAKDDREAPHGRQAGPSGKSYSSSDAACISMLYPGRCGGI